MIITSITALLSSLLLAIPAIRAAWRVLLARHKNKKAVRRELLLESLEGQTRQAEEALVERLKNQANDLIEFGTLVPTWAIWCALCGILLNIFSRGYPIFCQ